jgi:sugar-specific transcriptional regulator TrmB
MEISVILKNFGLSEKEVAVYLSLVELGPSPVRNIATKSKVNRGTTYDILKALIAQGIVSYYNKESKQYFIAEEPEKLLTAIDQKKEDLDEVRGHIEESLPLIKTLFEKQGGKPVVKFYEGSKGVRQIFEDVLSEVSSVANKTYYLYSSATLQHRKTVYDSFPDFSKKRIKKGIKVKIISLGEGGQLAGLDERKQMPTPPNPLFRKEEELPPFAKGRAGEGLGITHQIIYAGKVAHISIDQNQNPVGVVIQNQEIYQMQKIIFEFNWLKL